MKCRHCKFMERMRSTEEVLNIMKRERKRVPVTLRFCRIDLPPHIKTDGNIRVYLRSGCDLGQPKETRRKENLYSGSDRRKAPPVLFEYGMCVGNPPTFVDRRGKN